jgi:hypothetical protein
MDSKPEPIHITTSHREEISATHADLFVTVRGSHFQFREHGPRNETAISSPCR